MNGDATGPPTKMPVALIDILAAHHLKQGVLVALLKRNKSGKGSRVDVSLQDAAISSLANQATNYLMNGQVPSRIGSKHPNIAPYGDMFQTKDGKWIITAIGNDHQFHRFCQLIGADTLASDHRYATNIDRVRNRAELCSLIQKRVECITSDRLLNQALDLAVPLTAINDLATVFSAEKGNSMVLSENVNGQETKCVKTKIFSIS